MITEGGGQPGWGSGVFMLPSEEMETFHLGETGAIKLRLR